MSPTPEQFQAFLAMKYDVPVVIVNLLRFKPDGGAAEYAKDRVQKSEQSSRQSVLASSSRDREVSIWLGMLTGMSWLWLSIQTRWG